MSPDLRDRITFDPTRCGGRPCIRGYRLRVTDVLDMLASVATSDEILADYAFLEPADIQACLQYASEQIDQPVVIGAAWRGRSIPCRREPPSPTRGLADRARSPMRAYSRPWAGAGFGREIWARRRDAGSVIIVRKDEDFANRVRAGRPGPAVVWLPTGNGTTDRLIETLTPVIEVVEARPAEGDRLIEIR